MSKFKRYTDTPKSPTDHYYKYSIPANPQRFRFRRELLPSSIEYYADQGIKLTGGGAWRSALCPFHGDTKPSLYIRIETGGYHCKACGAKGGNVLDFHMQVTGLGFVDAAKSLGAWEGN